LLADYCTGTIWGLDSNGGHQRPAELAETHLSVSSFGESESGELYLVDHSGGGLYRVLAGATPG
jgi:hypothetical protein